MSDLFYRFRSVDNLLDRHNELSNQEIYFAGPEELNDPMEGFRDIFWTGDAIVWENLLRHYLLCLEHCCSLMLLVGDTHRLSGKDIPVFKTVATLPTALYQDLYREVCDNFFRACPPTESSECLAARKKPVRRNELVFHLSHIHHFAFEAILSAYQTHHLINEPPTATAAALFPEKLPTFPEIVDLLNRAEEEHSAISNLVETICSAQAHARSQIELAHLSNRKGMADFNRLFIFSQFPQRYVDAIEKMVYPEWYAACFMTECSNSSVWGHYADNHKGVCLIFEASKENGRAQIGLERITSRGTGGAHKGIARHEFHTVDYQRKYVEVDFFRALGRLPVPVMKECWYTGSQGAISTCSDDVFSDETSWRNRYWEKFYHGVTTKLREWAYENEARLLLTNALFDFSDPSDRKLKFRFSDLKGIIFGIRTPLEDKLRIADIVEAKCRAEGRQDFKFYQAYYSDAEGNIAHTEMSLLKFSSPQIGVEP